MSATRRTARKATTRRPSTRRRTTRRTTTTRRRTPRLATTLGAALGAVVVSLVTDLSWPTRIVVVVAVLLAGAGYLLWSHRAEIAAGAEHPDPDPGTAKAPDPTAPPTDPEQP